MNPIEIIKKTIDNFFSLNIDFFDRADLVQKILSDLNNAGWIIVKKESRASFKHATLTSKVEIEPSDINDLVEF